MGYRVSKVYTRTGDYGTTVVSGGARLPKNDALIEAMGVIDELNAHIGKLRQITEDQVVLLRDIQQHLFDVGAELSMSYSTPDYRAVSPHHVQMLEHAIDAINSVLPPLKEFVLPYGDARTVEAHVARAVARRAERRLSMYAQALPTSLAYLNRLSDYLFVLARSFSTWGEEQWNNVKRASK